jgi:hypothetical protein
MRIRRKSQKLGASRGNGAENEPRTKGSEASSLEAVRELEERITNRLHALDEADGPVHRARIEAEQQLVEARRDAKAAAERQLRSMVDRRREMVADVVEETDRAIAELSLRAARRRPADLRAIRAVVLPGAESLRAEEV